MHRPPVAAAAAARVLLWSSPCAGIRATLPALGHGGPAPGRLLLAVLSRRHQRAALRRRPVLTALLAQRILPERPSPHSRSGHGVAVTRRGHRRRHARASRDGLGGAPLAARRRRALRPGSVQESAPWWPPRPSPTSPPG